MFFPRALYSHTEVGKLNYLPTKSEYKAMKLLNFRCQCCGFCGVPRKEVPGAGLEFVDINKELKLLCLMCSQSQLLTRPILLENGSKELNHGRLVYCPEVTQGEIISITRDIQALTIYQKNNPNRALRVKIEVYRETYLETILKRCANIPTLKINNNDLGGYASLYKYAPPQLLKNENEVFGAVRYIPDDLVFSHVVKHWLNTSYQSIISSF